MYECICKKWKWWGGDIKLEIPTIYKALCDKLAFSINIFYLLRRYVLSLGQLEYVLFPLNDDGKDGKMKWILLRALFYLVNKFETEYDRTHQGTMEVFES